MKKKKLTLAEERSAMPEWLHAYYAGQDLASKTPTVVFESEHLAVVKVPGDHYWGGLTNSYMGYRPYAKQKFVLATKGMRWDRDPHHGTKLHEGRATKDILARLRRVLDEEEAKIK